MNVLGLHDGKCSTPEVGLVINKTTKILLYKNKVFHSNLIYGDFRDAGSHYVFLHEISTCYLVV